MSNEEKKNQLSANLAAALNPAKIENPANIDPVTRQEIQKKSLSELTEDYQVGTHMQEAGVQLAMTGAVKRGLALIGIKAILAHGEWLNWLAEHNLKKSLAANLMGIANRFGSNFHLNGNFNQTQLVAMLALPAGEEENFIAEKAAEGTPVEDMTVKNLKAEIADYKKRLAQAEEDAEGYKIANDQLDAQLENLGEENQRLREGREEDGKRIGGFIEENLNLKADNEELQDKIDDLENALLQKEPSTVEVAPADYEPTKQKLAEIEAENEKLQAELKDLHERPIEVMTEKPSDYDSLKAENAELKNAQKTLKSSYEQDLAYRESYKHLQHLNSYVSLQNFFKGLTADNPVASSELKQYRRFLVHVKNAIDEFFGEENANV